MTADRLNHPWNWTVLTIECPTCHASIPAATAGDHAGWHWLTNTETQRIETRA